MAVREFSTVGAAGWPKHSPWGAIQSATEEFPGVVWIDTAGHGGFWLSDERNDIVRYLLPGFRTFNSQGCGPWYEEDCDWAIVAVVFPECFVDVTRACRDALLTIRQTAGWNRENDGALGRWASVIEYIEGDHATARSVRMMAEQWETENKGRWIRCGMHSSCFIEMFGWSVMFRQIGNANAGIREVLMPYPSKDVWTDEELTALEEKADTILGSGAEGKVRA